MRTMGIKDSDDSVRISFKERLSSFFFDQVFIVAVAAISGVIVSVVERIQNSPEIAENYFDAHKTPLRLIESILTLSIYFNKDCFLGQSFGKRMMGIQIIDNKTQEPASAFQCLLRNLTLAFLPLELIITLFSRERRIGDFLANTKLVRFDVQKHNNEIKWIGVALTFLFSLLGSFFVVRYFESLNIF